MRALRKKPEERYATGLEFAAELTRVHQQLRKQQSKLDEQEHFDLLRGLRFFHDFSHGEIRELMRAGEWRTFEVGQEIVKEGDLDDRFYIIVEGRVNVNTGGRVVGSMASGECFGETSYVTDATRAASINAHEAVTLLRLSSTMLETLSTACQLRFNRVFLRSLISRLQGGSASPG
jgi:CRP-like cAMP-binding protein